MTRLLTFASLLSLAAGALSCGETTNTEVTQLNLDRPVDIAFACFGSMRFTNGELANDQQAIDVSAMPTSACEARSQPAIPVECSAATPKETEQPTPPGQETLRNGSCQIVSATTGVSWYGFVLESGPGTVAVVEFTTQATSSTNRVGGDAKVLDADKFTPGKNSISVGEDPVAIATDRDGCYALTANAGSCDMSVLDIASALDSDPAIKVDRMPILNAAGEEILSRPAAMVVEPSSTQVGYACAAKPTGRVFIAYPSCHLVAAIDSATGRIVGGIQYDAAGVPTVLADGNVTCPDDCGIDVATAGVRPVTLDLEVDPTSNTRRLAIGADNSSSIAIAELAFDYAIDSVAQVALDDPKGTLGVTALALSPEIGMGGNSAVINDNGPGGTFQFVYAVTTEGTVRVADVLDLRVECDTQVDPRFARDIRMPRALSCMPVGAQTTPRRRPGVTTPGIVLPGVAVPLSVAFIRSEGVMPETRLDGDPSKLVGYFALVTATNGSTFVVNVDDDNYADLFIPDKPLAVLPTLAIPHQLRNGVPRREITIDSEDQPPPDEDPTSTADDKFCDYNGLADSQASALGGPRIVGAPARNVPTGSVASAKLSQFPGLRQLLCTRHDESLTITELNYAAPDAVRNLAFPDLGALVFDETWTMTWEGSLSNDRLDTDANGPPIRESMLEIDGRGMRMVDQTKPYCDAGVEPFDILQMRGCDPSLGGADCPSSYSCFVHPASEVQGLGSCMLSSEASQLAEACKDYLTSIRRYTIKTASTGELLLLPRRHELRTSPLDGCTSDQQCQQLGDYALRITSASHPFEDETAADTHTWGCVADPSRAPIGGTGKRCQMRCSATTDCATGTVCQGGVAGEAVKSGFCMEGVTPSQSCVNATQRYELRAGDAFAVVGSRTGFQHPIIADPAGKCITNTLASPLLTGRIPLEPKDRAAPDTLLLCDPAADPLTGKRLDGTFDPNPCVATVGHTEQKVTYANGVCAVESTALVERQAPAVRFRNRGMNLTLVDPYYPGDGMCLSDRQGGLGKVPLVFPGFQLSFRQTAGFVAARIPAAAVFPVKVVRGPTDSIWILDEGDFLSTSASQASTRGKVFSVDPATFIVTILE